MSGRPCILHIGTHKTGTTSLQVFLQENAAAFGGAGLHVARPGRFLLQDGSGGVASMPGRHDLAWDLVADERGELDRFVAELQASHCDAAIASSEDFSLLYSRPHMLQTLQRSLQSAGYDVKILVFLRAQGPYAESMYVERIKHSHIRPIDAYVRTIAAEGRYVPEGTRQDIAFSYASLLEPFARVFGRENIAVRAYAPKDQADIFRDFLAALGAFYQPIQTARLDLVASQPRQNESLTFGHLLATLHNGLRPETVSYRPEISAELAGSRFALLRREEHLALLHRFAEENERIASEYGARIPFTSESDVAPAHDPVWNKVRLEREIFDRCLEDWTAAHRAEQMT